MSEETGSKSQMDSFREGMIKQHDIAGRLRLFRYGLIVITVTTFVLGLLYPWAAVRQVRDIVDADQLPALTTFLPFAALATVIVGVIMVVIYFAYAEVLKRTVGKSTEGTEG